MEAYYGKAILISACLAIFSLPWAAARADEAANTAYIEGLTYDLNKLLAVNLQPSSQPDYPDRERKSGQVIVCTKTKHDASADLTENALLNPSGGVVFPGAVIKQDQTLAQGLPTPYTLSRGPLTIRIGLPGLADNGNVTIASPTNVNVPAEIDTVIDYWFRIVSDKKGYKPSVRAFSTSQKAYTKEQLGLDLGFGAQWGKNSATLNLNVQSTGEQTAVYRAFKQIYYTVTIEEPGSAGSVFASSVSLNAANMPVAWPPGIVRSVDYGRIIIVQMSSNSQLTAQDAEGALDYVTAGGTQINTKLKEKYEKIKKNSSFKVLVLGGGGDAAELLSGNPDAIADAIKNGIEFSKESPAYPISYIVADLKSRAVSQMKTTTSYVETLCSVLPDRRIKMVHRGWYVAKFVVKWKENSGKGKFVQKSWDSGKKTNPWDHTLWFPGDARGFIVTGINDTGLVWDKHRQVSRRWDVLDGNKCAKIYGTTLNMKIGGC